MNQEDLITFLHLAGSGSLSATSRKLRIPKSSVSQSITRLEAETAIFLFERSTRHFRLTDADAALRPYAERAVHDLEEAQTALEDMGGEPEACCG